MACFSIWSAISFSRRNVDEAEAVRDLPPDEEIPPQRLFLRQGLVLVDGLDREVMRHAHRIVGEIEFLITDEDAARGRRENAGQHLDKRRLSGAIVADQSDCLVPADRKIDIAKRLDRAEKFLHALKPHYVREFFSPGCSIKLSTVTRVLLPAMHKALHILLSPNVKA